VRGILFVTGEYPAMQGGVGDYTRRLSQALGALGADIHVLTHVDAGNDYLRAPSEPYEPTVYPTLGGTGWELWRRTLAMVERVRPAVVHIQYQSAAYGLHPAVNYLPWRLRTLRDRPLILATFHDLRFPYLFPKAGPLRWQAVLALVRGGDASVITNPVDWIRLLKAGVTSRLLPIPIGSNIRMEPPAGFDREEQRARWGAKPDDWLLAYFGFLNANKGGETLVRTLAELVTAGCPARLLMVGGKVGSSDPTNVAYLERVEGLMRDLGVLDRVQWTGFTDASEVSANLLAADCAVLPYREGASMRHGSLMAALAHGLPIVTTKIAPEDSFPVDREESDAEAVFPMLRDGESARLVPPDDPQRTAAAVIEVMGDRTLRARLASGAVDLSHRFEWGTIARQHLDAYGKLAGS
jgi:glycosyltransferase involved in cell wall biosynthesis